LACFILSYLHHLNINSEKNYHCVGEIGNSASREKLSQLIQIKYQLNNKQMHILKAAITNKAIPTNRTANLQYKDRKQID